MDGSGKAAAGLMRGWEPVDVATGETVAYIIAKVRVPAALAAHARQPLPGYFMGASGRTTGEPSKRAHTNHLVTSKVSVSRCFGNARIHDYTGSARNKKPVYEKL